LWDCHIARIEANIIIQCLFPHWNLAFGSADPDDDDHFADFAVEWHSFYCRDLTRSKIPGTLLSLYYQVVLMWFTGRRLTASMSRTIKQTRKPAVASKPHDATAAHFGLKFAYGIHHKFKSSQASKARLQRSKHTGAKQLNLTQNGDSRSFKDTCFGVSGKTIKH